MPAATRSSRAYLLPAFDEFVVGYADRSAALDPGRTKHVNAGGGILKPTIVLDGRIVGTWQRRLERGKVVFSPTPFTSLTKAKMRAVTVELGRYAEFLGAKGVLTAD